MLPVVMTTYVMTCDINLQVVQSQREVTIPETLAIYAVALQKFQQPLKEQMLNFLLEKRSEKKRNLPP